MDSSKKFSNPSPEVTANPLSKLFFCWVLPFFKYGYQHDLEVKDIYNCTEADLSGPLGDILEKYWDEEVNDGKKFKHKPSLLRAIRRTFIKTYALQGINFFVQCVVIRIFQPIVLAAFIKYFSRKQKDPMMGWLLGSGVILLCFCHSILNHHANLAVQRIGMRCRIACCSLIYRKVLKLNKVSLEETAIGQLVNLLSNDVNRFDSAAIFLHFIWIMPIQVASAAIVMYTYVGWAFIAGLVAVTIQAVPVQGYLSRLQGKLRFKIALRTDNRVKLMNEITSGIQVIKMYAWEKPFEKVVELARRFEIDVVTTTSYIKGVSLALMVFTERATLFLTVIAYVLMGNKLSGDVVFSVAQIFNSIQLYMCILFPMGLSSLAEAKASIKRIEEFLIKEENAKDSIIPPEAETGLIKLTYAHASWVPNPIVDTLIDLNIEIKPGTLCCVVGSVGAGKSSLLHLFLKELQLSSGKMQIGGSTSYASQQPWLFVSTIRHNILFGQPFDKRRYNSTIKACALQTDFEQLPYGDKTLVGERGVSLSGGQRARINLARAVYREADIYLLDDPLSAVDPQVGKHLFERCIERFLIGKTRILVTHQLQFLNRADLIIMINNGKIEKVCGYSHLTKEDLINLQQETHDNEPGEKKDLHRKERLRSISSISTIVCDDDEFDDPKETQELMEKGTLSFKVYKDYYRAGASIALLIFLGILLILAQAASNACDLWLAYWNNQENKPNIDNSLEQNNMTKLSRNISTMTPGLMNISTTNLEMDFTTFVPLDDNVMFSNMTNDRVINDWLTRDVYIYIYTVFIILSIILTTARSLLFYKICMSASRNLHNSMFSNILQATMRFFDTNPSGRILSRFSKDMGAIDELLPYASLQALQVFLVASGILIMVFVVQPLMIIPSIILGSIFYWFRNVFIHGAQDIKRLEGINRAPVFSYMAASLDGLATIRASKAQRIVINEFDGLQDQHTGSWFLFIATYETFGFYLDVISMVFLIVVTFQFLIFDNGTTKDGNVGLIISQCMIIMGMLQHGVRQTAEVSSHMTSVERVLQYTRLDKEGPFQSAQKPKITWPEKGKVVFQKLYLRYVPGEEPILKNLNIAIQPGEKIGIVGRTGAGKSSLISALFRLAPIDGAILIDGVDTNTLGLTDLRSKISIIPQDPVLFSSSVRYNLDPFEKNSDEDLWTALENVELKDVIESLDQKVSEGGSNFSAGQRQLVCLARAIVRNNKLLVLDEATANVDPHTDALIQSTIRKNFKDCTVLTVAHRLNTIMDSNKVLVMNAGEAIEFSHPFELLQNEHSYFSKMVKETGPMMEKKLKEVAERHYKSEIEND